jgi:predicted signal transduction protein with EAL and GGDEF domain
LELDRAEGLRGILYPSPTQERAGLRLKQARYRVRLRASIGIAAIRPGYVDADAVIADAELARETARAQGGQKVVRFHPQLRSAIRGRERIHAELGEALPEKHFVLYFQPVVALDTGRPIGFEVLVRWHSLTRGLVPAAQFIDRVSEPGP